MDGAVSRSFSRCSACGCSHRLLPRRPGRSSSASSRGRRSMTGTSREWPPPGSGRTASCSTGGGCSPERDPSSGAQRTVSSASSPTTESGSCPPSGETRAGWRALREHPRLAGRTACRHGVVCSRGWWRATDPGAPTGPTNTAGGMEPAPRPCRSGPGRSGTSPTCTSSSRRTHRPAGTRGCSRSPTTRSRARIRGPGSCSPECPATGTWRPGTSSTASTRCRESRVASTPPPCTRTRAAYTASASTSSGSAR